MFSINSYNLHPKIYFINKFLVMNKLHIFIILCWYYVVNGQSCDEIGSLELGTNAGTIKGSCLCSDDGCVVSWLSVPYAEAPINENRFKAPKPLKNWNGILDGTKKPNPCMHYNKYSKNEKYSYLQDDPSEDCLYLNIFMSTKLFKQTSTKFPILTVFHGSLEGPMGSGLHDPNLFVLLNDIIVITVNYRLDIFGFLHLIDNNQSIQGNQGFLDQYTALKWINQNSAKFNGDSNRVTLMGSYSASKLIGYHLIFRPSKDYFRNIILQNDSPVNLAKNAMSSQMANSRAQYFAKEILGCKQGKLISCLQHMSASSLITASKYFRTTKIAKDDPLTSMLLQNAFGPVVDSKIFSNSPFRSFRLENYKKCSILTGYHQKAFPNSVLIKSGVITANSSIVFPQLVNFINRYYKFYPTWPFNNSDLIVNSILYEYTRQTLTSQENYLLKSDYRSVLNELFTDQSSACPVLKLIDYVKYSDVYLYKFEQNRSKEFYDESDMVFGRAIKNESFSPEEKKLSREMMKRWSNFVIFDNPNGIENDSIMWPKYNNQGQFGRDQGFEQFLFSVKRVEPTMLDRLEKCQLWNNLIPAQLDILAGMKKNSETTSKKSKKN